MYFSKLTVAGGSAATTPAVWDSCCIVSHTTSFEAGLIIGQLTLARFWVFWLFGQNAIRTEATCVQLDWREGSLDSRSHSLKAHVSVPLLLYHVDGDDADGCHSGMFFLSQKYSWNIWILSHLPSGDPYSAQTSNKALPQCPAWINSYCGYGPSDYLCSTKIPFLGHCNNSN